MSFHHLTSLLFKSIRLEKEIAQEHQRHWKDWVRLSKLKKLRLTIKDRMQKLLDHRSGIALQPVPVKARFNRNK